MIKFPNSHFDITIRTDKGINIKSIEALPFIPRKIRINICIFKRFNSFNKLVRFSSGIKTKPTNHFKIFRRQVNDDLGNKLINRHGNKSFLFIEFKIIKKESDRIMRDIRDFVFSNGSSSKISPEIFNNTFIVVNVTVTDIKEKSSINFVQIIDNFFSF